MNEASPSLPARPAGVSSPEHLRSGHVVCAPDKLRGALDAAGAAATLAAGVRDAGRTPVEIPVADGGEGTLDALVAAGRAELIEVSARDALGRWSACRIADLGSGHLVVEAADAIALAHLRDDEREPLSATSTGVGDLILAALDRGASLISVALGGSATVDGGLGMLRALGAGVAVDAVLLDCPGASLREVDSRLAETEVEVLYDVDVPLCGRDGAVLQFATQKGVRADDLDRLERAMVGWSAQLGSSAGARPGAGAAGGLGAALYAVGARGASGAGRLLELVDLPHRLRGASLCLTAEGSVDAGTLRGKAASAVLAASLTAGVPCAVIGGRVESGAAAALRDAGAWRVRALGDDSRALAVALAAAPDELRAAAAALTAEVAPSDGSS